MTKVPHYSLTNDIYNAAKVTSAMPSRRAGWTVKSLSARSCGSTAGAGGGAEAAPEYPGGAAAPAGAPSPPSQAFPC
eukprot:scaffold26542_cov22-Tisochrysis_lutea.AAC.4